MHPSIDTIMQRAPKALLRTVESCGELTLFVRREDVVEICRFLHDDPDLAFDHITDVTAVDFPNESPRFEVVYHFYSIQKKHRIRLKARVPEDDSVIDSICPIWQGANFLEREVYDMMGIVFRHHPDLRRILMTEDYNEGFPLRKDFPVEGHGWRDRFDDFMQTSAS